MHHAIWSEHDGSWTWSIEEGKAFEDGHQVLARDEGFPTRGDAKESMQKAWARLLDEGKKPGRPGAKNKKAPAPKTTAAKAAGFSPDLPEWAVIANGTIVAVFTSKTAAQKYCDTEHSDGGRVQKIRVGGVAT